MPHSGLELPTSTSGGAPRYVLKSFNFGANWTWIELPDFLQAIGAIKPDPTNDTVLYAVASNCIARSYDGAETWEYCWQPPGLEGSFKQLVIKDSNTMIVMRNGDVPVRTRDGGASWQLHCALNMYRSVVYCSRPTDASSPFTTTAEQMGGVESMPTSNCTSAASLALFTARSVRSTSPSGSASPPIRTSPSDVPIERKGRSDSAPCSHWARPLQASHSHLCRPPRRAEVRGDTCPCFLQIESRCQVSDMWCPARTAPTFLICSCR